MGIGMHSYATNKQEESIYICFLRSFISNLNNFFLLLLFLSCINFVSSASILLNTLITLKSFNHYFVDVQRDYYAPVIEINSKWIKS